MRLSVCLVYEGRRKKTQSMLVYAFKENRWRRQILDALICGLEFRLDT